MKIKHAQWLHGTDLYHVGIYFTTHTTPLFAQQADIKLISKNQ